MRKEELAVRQRLNIYTNYKYGRSSNTPNDTYLTILSLIFYRHRIRDLLYWQLQPIEGYQVYLPLSTHLLIIATAMVMPLWRGLKSTTVLPMRPQVGITSETLPAQIARVIHLIMHVGHMSVELVARDDGAALLALGANSMLLCKVVVQRWLRPE